MQQISKLLILFCAFVDFTFCSINCSLNALGFISRACLLVRQSFFHNDHKNFRDLGGGVSGCGGFHSSFRATQQGLSMNMG